MTKKDLIEVVSQKAKLSKKAAKVAVETFLNEIMKGLGNGETVKLSGFGTFKTKMFNESLASNPKCLNKSLAPNINV